MAITQVANVTPSMKTRKCLRMRRTTARQKTTMARAGKMEEEVLMTAAGARVLITERAKMQRIKTSHRNTALKTDAVTGTLVRLTPVATPASTRAKKRTGGFAEGAAALVHLTLAGVVRTAAATDTLVPTVATSTTRHSHKSTSLASRGSLGETTSSITSLAVVTSSTRSL